ncbi:MAG TPA: Gfo/Idh/MocA family oxidoreductase [Candidatus Elarobacter sp.]|nr:Gfo/Idh/MocA family oxidoreductase [Candidatus Elarobacter sp.]
MVSPRVAIVGCGLIGQKRARTLAPGALRVACDADAARANALAGAYGAEASTDWERALAREDVDLAIVATSHDALARITAHAAAHGKHVLVEKPAARRAHELDAVRDAVARTGAKVRVGFNHRYHRAFRQARAIVDTGALGELTHVRARYGHGGRLGYEKEWRFVPEISGGGEAIDQGMHLIDLARWFLGDFPNVAGAAPAYFWESPVEDNAFFLLRTARGQVASLHASWTEWKNLFSFELFGRTGKLEITGLGGSYGPERLAHYAMTPELGPPPTTIYEYPMADDSWEAEYAAFLEDIARDRVPDPSVEDARAALAIVEAVYAAEGRA